LKSGDTVKAQAITALKWTASARLSAQAISWAVTIYVVRILTPEDYGLMSMAIVFLALAILVNGIGVVPAFVQRKHVDRNLEQQVFGFLIVSNALLFLALQIGAPYFAAFFEQERLTAIIRVLAFSLLIGCVSTVKVASLQRALQFKGLSRVDFVSTVMGSFATLAFALSGFGVWALVLGFLFTILLKTIGLLLIDHKWVGPVFRFGSVMGLASFGAKMTAQQVVFYFNSNIDIVIVGKFLGNTVLGAYSTGFSLSMLPVSKTMGILSQVVFPAFAHLQDDIKRAKNYVLRGMRLTALVFFPVLWGLSSISSEFVEVVLGSQWQVAEIVLLTLPLAIPFRAIQFLLEPVLNGLGRSTVALANNLTFAVVTPVAVALGLSWGLTGISLTMAAGMLVGTSLSLHRSLRVLQSGFHDLIAVLGPAALAAAIMYAAVFSARSLLPDDLDGIRRLVVLVLVGGVVYCAATLVVNRAALKDLMTVLKPEKRLANSGNTDLDGDGTRVAGAEAAVDGSDAPKG